MTILISKANTSLDGYTEDKEGKFDWTDPNDVVFAFTSISFVRTERISMDGVCTRP